MLKILKNILFKNSPCRALQMIESQHHTLSGECLEIGNIEFNKKSFFHNLILLKNCKLYFADMTSLKKKDYFIINLEKKNRLKKKFDTIIVFNVFEHVYDLNNAIKEIKKILKIDGRIIISTPFIYRYHGAPEDFCRDTLDIYRNLSTFHNLKLIYKKNLGTGPFFASYSVLHNILNKAYPSNIFFLLICLLFDKFLSIFFKNLNSIYSICNFVILKK